MGIFKTTWYLWLGKSYTESNNNEDENENYLNTK